MPMCSYNALGSAACARRWGSHGSAGALRGRNLVRYPGSMRARTRRLLTWLTGVPILILLALRLLSKGFLPVFGTSGKRQEPHSAGIPGLLRRQQHSHRPRDESRPPAYTAGLYMTGRRPGNVSACQWRYGLPHSLSYPVKNLEWSPEAGERGPYRVLSSVILGAHSPPKEPFQELPRLTLCTHATADQVYAVVELARRWEGPLSMAIFVPGMDAALAVSLLDRACHCEPEMFKVSVHLVFPTGYPPALEPGIHPENNCAASDLQWREEETVRRIHDMVYPINVARNVARMKAYTNQVLVSDIELLPSKNLASGFLEMIRGRVPRARVVFVTPVFEIESNEVPPSTKKELLAAARSGLAVYFHRFQCAHCQRFPGLTRWMLRPDPGRVKPLIVTKREFPHHRWEPVFVGTRDDPFYTEDMSWEGRQDKMTQMFEMCLLNYRLVVLDGAFLVHTPGIKRKPTRNKNSQDDGIHMHVKKNARVYQNVVQRLQQQYPMNRRCRQ
ncbi:beta-1,4-glucuronyltransferase 1 [Cephus cinctus]|uniref:Beta-1,4-glucuronyltransferase 1 n=1 Tax=Cephus cinctus TaxID=211228 RepID=A0AAJ7BT47_CEPCN|nr:beta-1,4-glucuronyltransferase 1 [Cephus cinctus]XP_015593299.1 beta-1,4-glucuronyltransferase 1 [Cephus cinctus]XP_015593301.1 beta-1,4-glucuronyltransferase 1 [Cephus cinctus]XP_024939699.1 beta-1,4-glucuronyltransferase 1 [Cephus cinctus]